MKGRTRPKAVPVFMPVSVIFLNRLQKQSQQLEDYPTVRTNSQASCTPIACTDHTPIAPRCADEASQPISADTAWRRLKSPADGVEQLSILGWVHRFADCASGMSHEQTFTRRSSRLPARSPVDSMSNSFLGTLKRPRSAPKPAPTSAPGSLPRRQFPDRQRATPPGSN